MKNDQLLKSYSLTTLDAMKRMKGDEISTGNCPSRQISALMIEIVQKIAELSINITTFLQFPTLAHHSRPRTVNSNRVLKVNYTVVKASQDNARDYCLSFTSTIMYGNFLFRVQQNFLIDTFNGHRIVKRHFPEMADVLWLIMQQLYSNLLKN